MHRSSSTRSASSTVPLVLTQVVMPCRCACSRISRKSSPQKRLAAADVDLEHLHAGELVDEREALRRGPSSPRPGARRSADRQWLQLRLHASVISHVTFTGARRRVSLSLCGNDQAFRLEVLQEPRQPGRCAVAPVDGQHCGGGR